MEELEFSLEGSCRFCGKPCTEENLFDRGDAKFLMCEACEERYNAQNDTLAEAE